MKETKGLAIMKTSLGIHLTAGALLAGSILLALQASAQSGDGRGPAAAATGRASSAVKSAVGVPTAPAAAAPSGADEKVDVSDLEKKYWSTKDTDFNVVQNRLYSKAGRILLSGNFGMLINDPWSSGQAYGGSAAYYFSEHFGVEGLYDYVNAQDNTASQRLVTKGAYPDNNKINQFFGVNLLWAPIYAKMSLMSSAIIYFDMQFGLGAGFQSYVQRRDDGDQTKQTAAVEFDVTQHFYLSKHFAIRIDFKNRWYQDEVVFYRSTSITPGGNRTVSNNVDNTTLLMGGLTVMF